MKLTDKPIPSLSQAQIDKITKEHIRTTQLFEFNPKETSLLLDSKENQRVIAFDIGADKLAAGVYRVINRQVVMDGKMEILEKKQGEGFLTFMEDFRRQNGNLPITISTKSLTEGTKIFEHPDLAKLINDLGPYVDFAAFFPGVSVYNDAVTGILAACVRVTSLNPEVNKIVFPINGGGVGCSVWNEFIYATEAGHIELVDELNPFKEYTEACGFLDQEFTCIERLAGSGSGVERIYHKKTGKKLLGEEISKLYLSGDELALSLYDSSAIVLAHMIVGLFEVFNLKEQGSVAVIPHGGAFKVPGYKERVAQLLTQYLGFKPTLMVTYDFSENFSLDGAALASLIYGK